MVYKTKLYKDPVEAYSLMNAWTRVQTSYETQFFSKNVTHVEIKFKNEQPRLATVHYTDPKTGGIGVETIDLANKILLNNPHKPHFPLEKRLK